MPSFPGPDDPADADFLVILEPAFAPGAVHVVGSPVPLTRGRSASANRTGVAAHHSVEAALYAFLGHEGSYRDTVAFAIGPGGDTDTIAAMTMARRRAPRRTAIPSSWLEATEGIDRIQRAGVRFAMRWVSS